MVQERLGGRDRPEDRARHDLRDGVQLDGRRHDEAEPAAASAQRVEELRIVVRVELADVAVGGEQLHRDDRVRRHAVAPAVVTDAAAEQVADGPDGGGGPVEGDQAVRRRRLRHLAPAGAGEHGRPAPFDVHDDRIVEGDLDDGLVAQRRAGIGEVAGGEDTDAHAARAGVGDRLPGLVDVAHRRGERRLQVHVGVVGRRRLGVVQRPGLGPRERHASDRSAGTAYVSLHGRIRSMAPAAARTSPSAPRRPMICMPTGRPSTCPAGTEAAGCPVKFAG